MNEFKKLFGLRRILATALAFAMVLTSTPVTAQAAAPDNGQSVTETAAENDSAQDNTEGAAEQTDADKPADDGQAPADTDKPADDGQAPADTDKPADDGQAPADTDKPADDGQAPAGDGQSTTSEEGETQENAADADVQPQAELGGSVFALGEEAQEEYGYTETQEADGTYTPVSPFAAGKTLSSTFLSDFSIMVNKDTDKEQTLGLSETGNTVVDTVTWQWFQGDSPLDDNPKKLSEEGKLPVDAGEYTLHLVLPAKEGEYEGATADFDFEITKSEVTVSLDIPETVAVGTKWSDIPVPGLMDDVRADNGRSFVYVSDDPSTEANEAEKNEVSFTTVVKDAATGVALTDDETLKKNGEYVISVVPAFVDKKYEKNYVWAYCGGEQKLEIGDLKKTRLTLTPNAAYKAVSAEATDDKRPVYVIEDASLIKDLAKLEYIPVLEAEDGTDAQGNTTWKALDATKVTAEWYTAASYGGTWKENDKVFCNLALGSRLGENEVPEYAGAYVYRVSYAGDQEEFAASYADIVVVIESAEIIVRPVAPGKTFYDGQSVKDVLSQITYELPYADDTAGVYPQTEYMWGTSYAPSGVTQPYKPDFELVEIVRDKDGKETARHTFNSSGTDSNNGIYGAVLHDGAEYEYFVRFNGRKNVYSADGSVRNSKGINDQVDSMDPKTCGFRVKTDSDTLENNIYTLTVAKKDKTVDVSGIEAGQKEPVGALENAFVKTYDGKRIFDHFADYKKAKLTSGESDPVNDFTYEWSKSEYSYEDLLEKDPDKKDAWAVSREDLDAGSWDTVRGISPYNAGVYRLRVSYRNSRKNGFAEPVDLYFVIKRQDITFKFTKQNLTGNVGNDIYDFTENHKWEIADSTTLTPALPQPTKAEDWKNAAIADWDDVYQYEVNWGFYQKRMKTDAEGNPTQEQDKDADGNLLWDPVYSLSGTGEYYLGAESIALEPYGIAENYKVSNDVYCPITVESMGRNQIRFTGITTADGKVIERKKTYDAESVYALIKDDFAKLNAPRAFLVDETGTETDKSEPVSFAEGEYGLRYTVLYTSPDDEWTDTYIYDGEFPTDEDEWAWTANAGLYQISASFGGNKNYAVLYDTLLAEITVEQKELTLTVPALEREFEAGQPVTEVLDEADRVFREADTAAVKPADGVKIPDADMQKYFTKTEKDGKSGFLAWYDRWGSGFYAPEFYVTDRESGTDYTNENPDTLLQGAGSKRYSLNAYGADFSEDCYNNYRIAGTEPAEGTPVKVVRGASSVDIWGYDDNHRDGGDNGKEIDIWDEISVPKETSGSIVKEHTVTILDGIPYDNSRGDGGNIVDICIIAPKEYDRPVDWSNVYYEQAIRKAAGDRLIEDEGIRLENDGVLSFTYDATARKGEKKEDLDFSIRWEEGYSEHFIIKFSGAELLGDLTEAVQPKSLAFNAVKTTMVVGEAQELDVKITKAQNADIICLGYEVTKHMPKSGDENQKVMHIDEYGKVTALAEGKATVEVFPMHLVDGVKTRIDGFKLTKVDITVKNVSAPKVTKVIPYADGVEVQYTPPKTNDGYRREIYVVEEKNVKADKFEKLIANVDDEGMQNQQWEGIFAAAPQFIAGSYEKAASNRVRNQKGVLTDAVKVRIGNLDPQKDYTVYVRNVSAVRSFADGCQVTLSAAGTVKGCKTAMRTVGDITAQLKDEPVRWLNDPSYEWEEDEQPTQDDIAAANAVGYEVPLIKDGRPNSVDIALEGAFYEAAGDLAKDKYLPLPLAGADLTELKKDFAAPKLAYYFNSYIYDGYDAWTGEPVIEDYGYTKTSDIAAVSNKGKVTFKQPGQVTIIAVDTVSGLPSNEVVIKVTAAADSMKAKNATMQVGQSIRLERLVEYKNGSAVLNQDHYSTYGRIDVEKAQESLKESGKEDSFDISDDGYLTAFAKDSLPKLKLTDKILEKSVEVKITAKELAKVKDLKAVNVIDNRFDVQFEMNPYAEAYRIEVKDAGRKTIRSIYVENIPFSEAPRAEDNRGNWVHDPDYSDDDWGSGVWGSTKPHYDDHWYRVDNGCRADKINGKWILTYRINRLTQMSKYQIEAKCLFGEAYSGTVSKSVTTTKLPACDDVLTGNSTAVQQGVTTICRLNETASVHTRAFVSGNTYSLWANVPNKAAQIAGTDTLTWTVSDKKVASVKAAPGGYSATLKALAPGSTVIEVKSKVLKGVIARVTITVSSVGDAYRNRDYYGDNEDLRGENPDKKELVTELTVGVATPVELSGGQSMQFKVVLTEAGEYEASQVTNGRKSYIDRWTKTGETAEEYTFSVDGPFTGSVVVERTGGDTGVNKRTPIGLNEKIPSTSNAWYVFTAAEDGFYGFKNWSSMVPSSSEIKVYKQNAGGGTNTTDEIPWNNYFFALKAGDVVYLQIQGSYSDLRLVKGAFETLDAGGSGTVSGHSEKWFAFTPAEMDEYELRLSDDESWASLYNAEFSSSVYWPESSDAGGKVYTGKCGSKVYIQVYNNTRDSLTVQMKKKDTFRKFGEDGSYTIEEQVFNSGDRLYLTYKIPADGFYTFICDASTGEGSGNAEIKREEQYVEGLYVGTGSTDKSAERYYAAGEEIYLEVYAYNTPATWTNVIFKAEKTGDAPVALTIDADAVPGTVESGKAVWYELEATVDGRYTVEFPQMPEAASGAYITAELYESISSEYANGYYIDLQTGGDFPAGILDAGEKRFVKVTADERQTFQIRVSKAEIKTANISGGDTVTLEELAFGANDSGSYEAVVKITAGESGVYTFVCADNDLTEFSVWRDSAMSESGETVRTETTADGVAMYTATFYMQAGESRYLSLRANSALTGVSLKVRGLTERKLGRANVQSGAYQWFSYTAKADGTYVFLSKDYSEDPKGWFFHDKADADNATTGSELNQRSFTSNDDHGNGGFAHVTDNNNFAKDIPMTAGETVWLAVGHYNLSSATTCDVYVWE